jgi:hypothetical protein
MMNPIRTLPVCTKTDSAFATAGCAFCRLNCRTPS